MPLENKDNFIIQSATLASSVEIQKKIDERNMNTLATQLSIKIDTKLANQNIPFDIQGFKSKIIKYLEQVYLNPDIPSIAKDKFKDDILKKIDLISTIEPSDITSLRKNRNIWSLGIESLELQTKFGNDEVKKQAYFFEKILDKNIREYIEPVSKSLVVAFSESQKQIGITQYHEKTLNTFQKNISLLDKKYGIDAIAEIDKITKDTKWNTGGDISREDLYRKIGMYVVNALNKKNPIPLGYHIQGIIKNGRLGQWSKQGKWTEAITPSGPKDIVDIVLEYGQIIWKFERTEWEIRETRSIALATGVSTDIKNILWMDQLKSEFDHITPENVEKKLKNASFADTVILMTQLTQLTPVIGDIWSWFDGIINAYSGINVDGAKLTTLERSLYGIFGVLWITVIGGIATRAHKAWKVAQLLKSLEGIKKYLPEKLENFLKTSGKISEPVKNQIIAFGKMMGGEVAIRIENMMVKNGMILNFTGQNTTPLNLIQPLSNTTKRKASSVIPWIKDTTVLKTSAWTVWVLTLLLLEENIRTWLSELDWIFFWYSWKEISEELQKIKNLPLEQKQLVLEWIQKNIQEKKYEIAIYNKFKIAIQKNPEISVHMFCLENGIIQNDTSMQYAYYTVEWKEDIKRILDTYADRTRYLTDYMRKHNGNAKNMIKDLYDVDIVWNANVELSGATLIFYLDPHDYNEKIGSKSSGGFSDRNKLQWWLVVIRNEGSEDWIKEVKIHEIQHAEDNIINKYMPIESSLKTEIVARIAEGSSITKSKSDLLTETWIYNYFEYLKTSHPESYSKKWNEHIKKANYYIEMAFLVQKEYPDNAQFMLSFTDINKWDQLIIHKII